MDGLMIGLLAVLPASPAGGWNQEVLRVPERGAAVLEYRHRAVPFKPYVLRLRTPAGANILRDNVADHLHHHGLMLAWRVDGVNFWEETAESGSQVSEGARTAGNGIEDTLAWVAPGGTRTLLREKRRVEVLRSGDPRATLIGWRSEFALPRGASGPAVIAGGHYHGLGMRFLQSMDGGAFVSSDGDPGTVFRGEERLLRGRWCAFRAAADGREVTVAMFDHPDNPRPATWFTMARPFAYLSATLRLHEAPLELEAGRSLVIRYGVAVWDGRAQADEIDRARGAWIRQAGPRAGR